VAWREVQCSGSSWNNQGNWASRPLQNTEAATWANLRSKAAARTNHHRADLNKPSNSFVVKAMAKMDQAPFGVTNCPRDLLEISSGPHVYPNQVYSTWRKYYRLTAFCMVIAVSTNMRHLVCTNALGADNDCTNSDCLRLE
jgi:hypothetical protein